MGLIGGSFEKAFRAAGLDVRDLKAASSPEIGGCALVVVCLPPRLVAPWIKEHAGDFAAGAFVVDAAGVKGVVCRELADVARAARWTFVGGHPMAGKEVSGYANSDAALFRGASMILTPYEWTPPDAVERLKELLAPVGFGRFVVTDPAHHDEMIAYTSQLAHVVSSAYIQDPLAQDHAGYSAGSFRDMTRVARLDPDIWTELFLANRDALLVTLEGLVARLDAYRAALAARDADALRALLAAGRTACLSCP
jgi:prephenate dehydrogenase